MALGIRGANPIWAEFDLEGNLFDDTFYLYVLQNTLPYLPATVYHDPDLSVPWTNPIQFLGNGTLPVDIFFESDVVYRLEFRQNNGIDTPSQNDALIYEVNNYVAGTGGSTPVDTVAFASSNQITNPQFSLISFASPFSLSGATNPDPIEVAPGWFLELAGSGNVALERIPLNNTLPNPSNAPYALRITLTGWNSNGVFLRQRFEQNGMLWANKIVSSTITARLEGAPQTISANLVDSNASTLAQVLPVTAVNESFNEFTGYGQLTASTNPDVPPAAYIDYKLSLPNNVDIYVTSFQLVVQELPIEPSFEQDSIDRQIDHTFHYYRDSLLLMPKSSILTGWNFGLNPWQARTTGQVTLSTFGYTADQTIMIQQNYVNASVGSNIATLRAGAVQNYGYAVIPLTAANQFAMVQYIDPSDIRQYWGYTMSSLARIYLTRQLTTSPFRVKMRLIYRTSLPPTLTQSEPIATWTSGGDPVFAAGWTALIPKNDPAYPLSNGYNDIAFEGMDLPASSSDNMTLGIVLYTIDNLGTAIPDSIIINDVSLVPNEFAIASNVLTFDETLARCQFHYQKSFAIGTVPADNAGANFAALGAQTTGASQANSGGPNVRFPTYMRATPTVTLYNTTAAANNQIYNNGIGASWSGSSAQIVSQWGFVAVGTSAPGSSIGNGSQVHWTANARMG